MLLEVTPEAVELGWAFFGPQIGAMVAGMRAFTGAELATVGRFLDAMSDIAVRQRDRPAGQDRTSQDRTG